MNVGQSGSDWCTSKWRSGNESPWSMPMIVGQFSARRAASHSAVPLRVQYLRGLGNGDTSFAAVAPSAQWTRKPLQSGFGRLGAGIIDADVPGESGGQPCGL